MGAHSCIRTYILDEFQKFNRSQKKQILLRICLFIVANATNFRSNYHADRMVDFVSFSPRSENMRALRTDEK